ncbi:prephenate dehydrogenase/arogenate dehydrogenase family protein [Nanoarchaeota archaeon]
MKIGIIGGTGLMGQWFKRFFELRGYEVVISGRKTSISMEDCAKDCDIVIVSVPIDCTVDIIKKIGPHVKEESLLMDFTSLKTEPVKAMLKYSKANVLGMHPVFGPGVQIIRNQTIVLTPGRGKKWLEWATNLFEKAGAKVRVTTPEKHDEMMSIIQGMTHFTAISIGYALKDLGVSIEESMQYTSPIYKLRMDTIGRILNQDPNLYADIEIMNPHTTKVTDAYIKASQKLQSLIEKKDKKGFVKYFNDAANFIGSFKKEAEEYSDYIVEKLVRKRK